jgi:hypothetical protein
MVPRLQSSALIAGGDRFWQLTESDRFIHPLATQQNVPDNEPALTQIRQLAPQSAEAISLFVIPVQHSLGDCQNQAVPRWLVSVTKGQIVP